MLVKLFGGKRNFIWFFVFMGAYFTFDWWLKQRISKPEVYDSIDALRSACDQDLKGAGLYVLFKLRESSSRETVTKSGSSGVIKYWISSSPVDIYPVNNYCEVKHVDSVITSVVWKSGGPGYDPR